MDGALVATIMLGTATVIVAWVQFEVMSRQREIMDEQTRLMNRQLTIAEEQATIVLRQLDAVPILRPEFSLAEWTDAPSAVYIDFIVSNEGTRTARGFTWQCGVKREQGFSVEAQAAGQVTLDVVPLVEGDVYSLARWRVYEPLYKQRKAVACRFKIQGAKAGQQLQFASQIAWDEDEYPQRGRL